MNLDEIQREHRAVAECVFGELLDPLERLARLVVDSLKAGGKIMACGNGGSASDAQHLAGELVNRFLLNRRPYAALALGTDVAVTTSIGNDFSFEEIFKKQVEALGRAGDVLIGFSTSGNSENVLRAFRVARDAGIRTVLFSGGTGGRLAELADFALVVSAASHTPRVQEGHELMMHILCERVEELMEGAEA